MLLPCVCKNNVGGPIKRNYKVPGLNLKTQSHPRWLPACLRLLLPYSLCLLLTMLTVANRADGVTVT